ASVLGVGAGSLSTNASTAKPIEPNSIWYAELTRGARLSWLRAWYTEPLDQATAAASKASVAMVSACTPLESEGSVSTTMPPKPISSETNSSGEGSLRSHIASTTAAQMGEAATSSAARPDSVRCSAKVTRP